MLDQKDWKTVAFEQFQFFDPTGTVPLGYDAKDKKLVVNRVEAETVRTIFRLYLEVKSFGKLLAELDRRKIVTKRRNSKIAKYQGGIPFTYGPLAHFLKNRIYLGEIHHSDKWFKGEHQAILDRRTFEQVQELLKFNINGRRIKYSANGAVLRGKLFDDKGNRMGPSFSSKKGVRYRFYISTALRGRKYRAGSVARISAPEIEAIVDSAVRQRLEHQDASRVVLFGRIDRVVIREDRVQVALKSQGTEEGAAADTIEIPWTRNKPNCASVSSPPPGGKPDLKLLQAVARAHNWLNDLSNEVMNRPEFAGGSNS